MHCLALLPVWLISSGCTLLHSKGNDDVVHTSLKALPLGKGSVDEATGILKSSLRASRRGVKLFLAEELPAATEAFEKAVSLDPTNGMAHNNLGLIRFDERRLADAADHFNAAAEYLPQAATPLNNLGMTLEAGGRTSEAISYYERASMLEPKNPLYLGNLVRAKIRMGDQGDHVLSQLQTLAMIDNRPQWVQWVKDQLALDFNPLLDRGGDSVSENPLASDKDSDNDSDADRNSDDRQVELEPARPSVPSNPSIHDELDLGPGESLMGAPSLSEWPENETLLQDRLSLLRPRRIRSQKPSASRLE